MTEKHIEYLFVARLIEEMQQQLNIMKVQLQEKRMDIWLNSAIKKLSADIVELRKIEVQLGLELFPHYEQKYGIVFQFLRQEPAKPKPEFANGSN